jgi:chromosome segregation ATPase
MPEEHSDDLEPRVSAVERDLAELRDRVGSAETDAAAARILAAGADRDVSEVRAELRAHMRAINALGEAQRETRLELSGKVASLGAKVTSLETEMRRGFATMNTGMTQIVELLRGDEPRA